MAILSQDIYRIQNFHGLRFRRMAINLTVEHGLSEIARHRDRDKLKSICRL